MENIQTKIEKVNFC